MIWASSAAYRRQYRARAGVAAESDAPEALAMAVGACWGVDDFEVTSGG
jgi:hypothetical protein